MVPKQTTNGVVVETSKRRRKEKNLTPEQKFHHTLTACSRSNDLPTALAVYDAAVASGDPRLSSYHFNTLLHIFSSVHNDPDSSAEKSTVDAAFRVFDHMVSTGIKPTEATITSMARIAACDESLDGGGRAFDLVRNMGERYGLLPKLRTYGPALFAFCRRAESADKAYEVEEHMVAMRVMPEEQELAALLRVSSEAGREEKVYGYLQKFRSCVGCVDPSTAEIVERWFQSGVAAEVGMENWDVRKVKDAILMNGGGWHGEGWLGKGKWSVSRSKIGLEGCCCCCAERLACVDISRMETEKFAESVASLAMEREVVSSFRNFQDWLGSHGDYNAIIDGANVGYYQQNFADGGFCLSQLENVVEEFKRSQGKIPLVILHNKRLLTLMENPSYRQVLEDWRTQGTLYATPNGSNDDWYWLYAAVKLKCLLVTNDEMRDHIFELLGRNFFPKWKERHQVRYTFLKGLLKLEMPHPYSTVIQESEKGSWHVPLDEKCEERLRTWVCINRYQLKEDSDKAEQLLHSTTDSHQLDDFRTISLGKRKDRS